MATMREEVYEKMHPFFEQLVDLTCTQMEDNVQIPEIELLSTDSGEKLIINSNLAATSSHFSAVDILEILNNYGIIEFEAK